MLKVLDLFSGIGGFSLGLERTGGFETVAFCEIEPFPRRVLAKHWPEVPIYEDVRSLTGDILARDGIAVDVITGGFPCQDISVAGKQAGIGEGTRSGLWSEIVRLIGELSPRYVIVENVANLLSGPSEKRGGWFGRVLGDLAECGYDAEWENIPASALGAPHRRERIWIVAWPAIGRDLADANENYARRAPDAGVGLIANEGREGVAKRRDSLADAHNLHDQGQQPSITNAQGRPRSFLGPLGSRCNGDRWWQVEPAMGRVAYGVPNRAHRLAGLGNAVVPQIPELIGHAILQTEASHA